MKICFIARDYGSIQMGGIATYLRDISHALVRRGHQVHIICETYDHPSPYTDDGVRVYPVRATRITALSYALKKMRQEKIEGAIWKFVNIISVNCKTFRIFRQLHQKIHFDIVESEDGGGIGLLPAHYFPKMITKIHTPWGVWERLNGVAVTGITYRFEKSIEAAQFRRSFALNANSFAMRKEIEKTYGIKSSRIHVLPYGIDSTRVKRFAKQGSPRVYGKYLLYFGRLEARKGCDTLADALPRILAKNPKYKMVFVGDEFDSARPFRRKIIEKNRTYKDRILFFPKLEQEMLLPIVDHAAAVILPSDWEAFGYTCLESMILGKIVIASSGSGFEELIGKDNINGFLFPAKDAIALATQVNKALSQSEEEHIQMSKNITTRAQSFDIRKNVVTVERYYQRIIRSQYRGKLRKR